jgi:hypothetical protein
MTYTAAELAFYSHPVPCQTGNCHLVMARIWHDTDRNGGAHSGHGEQRQDRQAVWSPGGARRRSARSQP